MWAREPYRLFFPLGILASMVGVSLWGLLYAGWLPWYPATAHARVMSAGFMGAFVLGFLGTAFPRLIGAPACSKAEVALLAALWAIATGCYASAAIPAGDVWFALTILALAHILGARWLFLSRDVPPPGFPLALLGVLGGAAAAITLACSSIARLEPFTISFAKLLLYQGFPLLPILGIAPFLWPRFFGRSSPHHFDESPTLPAGWKKHAMVAGIAGLALLASWAIEASGRIGPAHALRATCLLVWALAFTPVARRASRPGTAANALRWAVLSLVAGCALAAVYPAARIGSLHFVLVSGIGLVTLVVATRVVFGHSGQIALLNGRLVWLRWLVGLLLIAAATRAVVDFVPKVKVSHHLYAMALWLAACLLWIVRTRRCWSREDDD